MVFPFVSSGNNKFIIQFQLKDSETDQPLMGHLDLFPMNEKGYPVRPQISVVDALARTETAYITAHSPIFPAASAMSL